MENRKFLWILPPLVAFAIYWQCRTFGLVWDDFEILNDLLPLYENIKDAFIQKGLYGLPARYYRPVVQLSLMFNRWVFDGIHAAPLHVTMISIHAIATLFCYGILSKFFKSHPWGWLGALTGALFFAVHPIHTEVVAWISGHPDGWMTLFFLGSFFFFLDFRETGKTLKLALSLGFFLFALLAKETAIVLLPLIFLYDFLFPVKRKGKWGFLAVFLLYFILRSQFVGNSSLPPSGESNFFAMLGKISLAYGFYIEKTLYPFHLNAFVREIPQHLYIMIAGGVFLAGVIIFTFTRFRKKQPLLFFNLIFLSVTLAPAIVLAIFPVARTAAAERYLYLPSFAFCFFLGWLILKKPVLWGILLLPLFCAYGFKTVSHLPTWKDELAFWQEASSQNPGEGLPFFNLGLAYKRKGDDEKALELYQKALQAKYDTQGRAIVYNSMGVLYLGRREYELAEDYLKKSIDEIPSAYPYCNLGVLYHLKADALQAGKKPWLEKSVEFLKTCVEKTPKNKKWENLLEAAKKDLAKVQ